jgi:pSer/pThr/pTyr-binding forkhead associated (FHA) protein
MPILRLTLPNQSKELSYVLDGARITIGRGPDNTIQIPDRSVSAHHAELIDAHGRYRLHDLESTNLTCVNDRPVRDFHLHVACRIRFGNVVADFSPEAPNSRDVPHNGLAPTQSEIDFLKRDNLDLQKKIDALQRQLDILASAPLMPFDPERATVSTEVHRRVIEERDALRHEIATLKRDADNSRCDIDAILRDRDALRQALLTAKTDLAKTTA